MAEQRRVVLINATSFYVGPAISRLLAARGHDLVIGDPADGLIEELESMGAAVEAVDGGTDLAEPGVSDRLVAAALGRFGRIDAAVCWSGVIVTGRFTDSTPEDLAAVVKGCMEAPYRFMRSVVPVMVDQGGGQILVITSASASRPTPGAPLYSAARAGATMMVKNVAMEVARTGVQVNAVGTNFMDFPEFLRASGVTDEASRERIESRVPMKRLGTLEEFASFCMPFVDGSSGFTTGQFVAYAGGWA